MPLFTSSIRTRAAAVAMFAFFCVPLGWNLSTTGIASGEIDPVAKFGAQDEAVYTREAIQMVLHGGWMTPTLFGRLVFEKPPLLVWLMALSMKLFGISSLTARIPVVAAGAFACTVCWWMARRLAGEGAGGLAAALTLTSQIVFTMSRHAMTDIVMAAGTVLSLLVLVRDPRLRTWTGAAGFVIAAMACLLTKSIAGLLPLAALAVFCLVARTGERPSWSRAAVVSGCALGGAALWFGYCFLTYRNWFLADTAFQIFTVGSGQHQTSPEGHAWFYLKRLMYSDVLSVLLLVTALPVLARRSYGRSREAILLAAYLGVFAAGLATFRFHSEQYLCWLIPLMIVPGVVYSPLVRGKKIWIGVGLCVALFAVRLAHPEQVWGMSTRAGTTVAAAPLLRQYCEEHRAVDLYILDMNDEFYGMALPLYRVRYGWIEPSEDSLRQHPYLGKLGVLLRARDMDSGSAGRAGYRRQLREWGAASDEAIGSGIVARDASELRSIVWANPGSDFLISTRVWRASGGSFSNDSGHRVTATLGDGVLLEARQDVALVGAQWGCAM